MISPKPISGGLPCNDLMVQLERDPAWIGQAKIDGWRSAWDGEELRSRSGLLLHQRSELIAELRDRFCGVAVDAEITFAAHRLPARLWCFDMPDWPGSLQDRIAELRARCAGCQWLQLVPHDVCWSDVLCTNWEGIVYKRLSSAYSRKKQTADWIKYRRQS